MNGYLRSGGEQFLPYRDTGWIEDELPRRSPVGPRADAVARDVGDPVSSFRFLCPNAVLAKGRLESADSFRVYDSEVRRVGLK